VDGGLRERLIAAGLGLLNERGAAELTVRRVAEYAGTSTMGIYSQFGGRTGLLQAIYRRGFDELRVALVAALSPSRQDEEDEEPTAEIPSHPPQDNADAIGAILALATSYRRFALDHPGLYSLMFERPVPDFDPSPELRSWALGETFSLLIEQVSRAQRAGLLAGRDPTRQAYLLWTITHGITSVELTHAARSALPGWFLNSDDVGVEVLCEGVRAVLAGMADR
jgi:AcrR family transcriptional regulator